MPAYISQIELEAAAERTGLPESDFQPLVDGPRIDVGKHVRLRFRHTPGHSQGSMVILVSELTADGEHGEITEGPPLLMISGDTLFPGSCGRVDLPESDAAGMWDSLQVVASYDDELVVFPGHAYGPPNTTIGTEKRRGLLAMSRQEWMQR